MVNFAVTSLAVLAQNVEDPSPSLAACSLAAGIQIVSEIEALPTHSTTTPRVAARCRAQKCKFQRYEIREPGLPTKRFIGGISDGKSWVVAYEHGIEDPKHIISFTQLGAAEKRDFHTTPNANLVGDLCPAAIASLSGVYGSAPGHY